LTYPWPKPEALRDLVYSRLLPVRQTVGQFLARYSPASIAEGLKAVTVSHGPDLAAEARVSLGWLHRRLVCCGIKESEVNFSAAPVKPGSLGITFAYSDQTKFFRWTGDIGTRSAHFDANFGSGRAQLSAPVSLLAPEVALSEAMFF
jgi:hypothetical protein